jgi:hypothetical protein
MGVVIDEKIDRLIRELEFKGVKELIKDSLITEILYRISSFSEERDKFEKKYGKSFIEFKKEYEVGEEDFEKYDDLMAWEFAQHGREYWEKKLEEIKSVL